MTNDVFGSSLRRIRLERGVTLAQIAESTKIAEDLLEGLERNDVSDWPSGILARAYVRQYAAAIGVDPDETVDEFCRCFPQGDRRFDHLFRELSTISNEPFAWRDEDEHARRSTDPQSRQGSHEPAKSSLLARLRNLLLAPR